MKLAGNLALGQQRVLEVARALAAGPLLIMLDEARCRPPQSGEEGAWPSCCAVCAPTGKTILLCRARHGLRRASLADRVVVLDFGQEACRRRAVGNPGQFGCAGSLSRSVERPRCSKPRTVGVLWQAECCEGCQLRRRGRQDRHHYRPERSRQDHAAQGADGTTAGTRPD